MKVYKFVIFDWDGTLMDSAAKIAHCMQLAAKRCDVGVPTFEQVGQIIGISLRPAIQTLFQITDDTLTDKLVEAYKTVFLQQDQTPSPLFPGVHDLLTALGDDNRILAVATGKARRGLERAWDNTQTRAYFTYSRTADDAESKPSPDMILQLLAEAKVSPEEAVMVGDTTFDMQMARDAGIDRIGVSYGVHGQVHLERFAPVALVHSVYELERFLLGAASSQQQ
ncbi:HAD-IA family hydrolase [Alteromonas sp. C1M14]|uniref:HAD family hydrolase n=1 Tax=Alteromonas sp. C1M14 TaxID=2841567 RepID=UPI001C09D03F|nr:HAD-IA family hydrolase [Alteromonas sp. C1M14]MBU2976708.1 HAD-IA family hydrolase [Alteromonas sp. C1M14]